MSTEAVAGRVVVGRYELIETLGTGPMGPVWRAHDRRLQREVAVREVELPDILDDAEQAALAEKVLREASAASQLDHPAAVTVLDVVTEAGQPFVVSELVTARTLVEVVESNGALPPERVVAIGLSLIDALAAAHDLGLVHRDVRPSNVLLTDTGARLTDFGVASMVDDPRLTIHEPTYLAPEQTESAGATALADLWSLGATLYFAVEGEPPFDEGSPAATIAAIVNDAPRPAQRAGALQPVLDALLVKDAMDRPDDAATRGLLAIAVGERSPAVAAPEPPPDPFVPEPVVAEEPTHEPPTSDGSMADSLLTDSPAWAADGPPPPPEIDDPDEREASAQTPAVVDDDEIWSVLPSRPSAEPARPSPTSPVVADAPAADPFARPEPVSAQDPFARPEPVPAHEPVSAHDLVSAHEPVSARGLVPTHEPVSAHDLASAREPVSAHDLVSTPEPVWAQDTGTGVHDPLAAHDHVATGTLATHDPAEGPPSTRREPWFFHFPVETVPPPPLPEPPPRPVVEPVRPPGRLPRGVWAAMIATLIAGVMIALIITGGHTLRAQRPSIDTSKGPGAVSTWVPYTDSATGFTIRYPPNWSVRRTGSQTFFVDPAGTSYLEIDHQQPPASSLTASAFDQEKSFSAGHPTYKRISIEPTTYQDKPASLWQFTYTDGGANIRAIDLGVNSPKYGFALFFQARADDWTRAQGTFANFKSLFGMPN